MNSVVIILTSIAILLSILLIYLTHIEMKSVGSVAVFNTDTIKGEAVAKAVGRSTQLDVVFTALPKGAHGFHIHTAGDLRGEGCKGACAHWHVGSAATAHGGPPGSPGPRHTGDLGNIEIPEGKAEFKATYTLRGISPADLWGRTLIIHADPDDLGKGPHDDSHTTGHSGSRIGCAIFGRTMGCDSATKRTTRKH